MATGIGKGGVRAPSSVTALRTGHTPPPSAVMPPARTEPPEGLTPAARDFWLDVVPTLVANGWAADIDRPLLAQLAEMHATCQAARADIAKRGALVVGQKGELVKNSSFLILAGTLPTLHAVSSRFGLAGPETRSRLAAPAPPAAASQDLLSG